MTRIKEPEINSDQIPDYKSPPSRIIRSLLAAYDNLRGKVEEKSSEIHAYQGKLRDVTNSREKWKTEAKTAQNELKKVLIKQAALEAEFEKYKKKQ